MDTHITSTIDASSQDLLGYFLRRVSSPEDAADLLGETLLVLWRRADDLPAEPLEARLWMFGIARRVLSTYRRAGLRRVALADRLRLELEVRTSASERSTEGEELHALLLELDLLDQEIIRLVHWEGFSLAEVATILARRPGTIRSRYARARTSLRKAIDDQNGGL
ncbi:RNA polymerase sigma factor [Frigoribacterium sp. PvP032]|uniref:RNA polymerase sigma factor n=1 Tax=Frigoribacterium sp. PvP032 TaxID=2806589 RepID=UPI001AE99A5D|nr:RNA polymerase sigma factor [Frigoribacterium sp. PvP032]MBP1190894.1 RNA polymerase sigma-70 factor (ECF subfamily) [Frigoribacterium sp. PvP032]